MPEHECIECRGDKIIEGNTYRIPCYECQPHKRCVICRRVYFDNDECKWCACGGPLIERKAGEK